MSTVTEAVLRTGAVEGTALDEMAKWGTHIVQRGPSTTTLDESLAVLWEALEKTEVHETDLRVLSRYFQPDKYGLKAVLHFKSDEGKVATATVQATDLGYDEIAVPWTHEDEPAYLLGAKVVTQTVPKTTRYVYHWRRVFVNNTPAFLVLSLQKKETV